MKRKDIMKTSRRAKIAIPSKAITVKKVLKRRILRRPNFSTKKMEMNVKKKPAKP